MSDARVDPFIDIAVATADPLHLLEIWGDLAAVFDRAAELGLAPFPGACQSSQALGRRLLWWEPKSWLIRSMADATTPSPIGWEAAAGADGALIELTGAFARLRLTGRGWRDLLMIGGVFDAEARSFKTGSVAGTVLFHCPVRIDVVADVIVDVYTPPSYVDDLLDYWKGPAKRLNERAPPEADDRRSA